jgi:hypothetical protein
MTNDRLCFTCVYFDQWDPDDEASITECHAPDNEVHNPNRTDSCSQWIGMVYHPAHELAAFNVSEDD